MINNCLIFVFLLNLNFYTILLKLIKIYNLLFLDFFIIFFLMLIKIARFGHSFLILILYLTSFKKKSLFRESIDNISELSF